MDLNELVNEIKTRIVEVLDREFPGCEVVKVRFDDKVNLWFDLDLNLAIPITKKLGEKE